MNTSKTIGIFMNYTSAHIMLFSEKPLEIQTIEAKFSSKWRKEKDKSEKFLCTLARHCKEDYLKNIAAIILQYDTVLLFGPTDAKTELFNMLSDDHRFYKIKTYIKETRQMTLNQRNRFLQEHFAGPLYESA
jgi:hypothetical protein